MIPVLSYYGNLCSIGRKNLATRRATVALAAGRYQPQRALPPS